MPSQTLQYVVELPKLLQAAIALAAVTEAALIEASILVIIAKYEKAARQRRHADGGTGNQQDLSWNRKQKPIDITLFCQF